MVSACHSHDLSQVPKKILLSIGNKKYIIIEIDKIL